MEPRETSTARVHEELVTGQSPCTVFGDRQTPHNGSGRDLNHQGHGKHEENCPAVEGDQGGHGPQALAKPASLSFLG